MIQRVVFLVVAGCSLQTSAQPGRCALDRHCQSGFYCMPELSLCQRCLDCGDLKRDPPNVPSACIRSVADCGSCIKGFVNDLHGDVTEECVVPPPAAALPTWAWALVSLVLVLFVLVVVAVLYMLRNTATFKILASTRTSVRSPGVVASEPEAPPPYRAHYHHPPEHRHHHHHDTDTDHTDHYDTDTDRPARDRRDLLTDFVDPSAPRDDGSPPASPRAARKPRAPPCGARESSARQETRYFNEPYYVRPPTYSDAGESSPVSRAPEPPSLHDEDTMESTWTAAPPDDNGNAASGSELADLLAARPDDQRPPQHPSQHPSQHPLQHPLQHHSGHRPCVQDSNNNRSSGAASLDADPSGSFQPGAGLRAYPHAPVSYIINVVQNMQNKT